MAKRLSAAVLAFSLLVNMFCQKVYAFPELPDVVGIAQEAASGLKEAASGTAKQAGDAISNAAGSAGKTIAGVADQAGIIASGFASKAGDVLAVWSENAGKTADQVKKKLGEAGITMKVNAAELGNATVAEASKLAEKAGHTVDDAMNAVSYASNLVVDQTGHVVNLASVGMENATEAAVEAFTIIQEQGTILMKSAEDAVADIDFNDQQNWSIARGKVDEVLEAACTEGMLGNKIDTDVLHLVTSVVFGAMMYGYQYSEGQITLGEYAASMSEVLIREGLPTGVGFVVSILPIGRFPNADGMARDAVYYLIAVAYGDKTESEIEADEKMTLQEIN